MNIQWNKEEIAMLLENNSEIVKKFLMELHYQDHQIKEDLGNHNYILEYTNPRYRNDGELTVNLLEEEVILNLGFENLMELFKEFNLEKMDTCPDKDIKNRMLDFMTNVMSPIIDIDKYEIRITDGDLDSPYYIASFVKYKKYLSNKDYLDSSLGAFKASSKYYVVFELDKYAKSSLNLTGESFCRRNENSLELLRGLLLSYIYFGNNEFQD